jgi:DNA-binding NarL/FixJ family response regulator
MNSGQISVIIADDHTLFRDGLKRMLTSFAGVKVVAEASCANETLAAIRQVGADVLVLDLSMPGVTGVSLIEAVHGASPELPILILSMHDEVPLVRQALKTGASGFVTKDISPDTLFAAVSKLAGGGRYVSANIAESLAFGFEDEAPGNAVTALTQRELQILGLLAKDGLSMVDIADRLGLSPKTITAHKANIMTKLGVANNVELIRYVIDHRLFA